MAHRKPHGYVPALGFDWLTPLYDPLLRALLREATAFDPALPAASFDRVRSSLVLHHLSFKAPLAA